MERADTDYISLAEAAKLTTYSQEYVSLLCRRGKMNGKKFGRNWFIKKEDVYDYINKTNGKGESIIPIRFELKKTDRKNEKTFQNPKFVEGFDDILNIEKRVVETSSVGNKNHEAELQSSSVVQNKDIKKDFSLVGLGQTDKTDDENSTEDEIDEKYKAYIKTSNYNLYSSKPLEAFESQKQSFAFMKKAIVAAFLMNIIVLNLIITLLAVPFWSDISKKMETISQESKRAISFLDIFDSEKKVKNNGIEMGSVAGAEISGEENSLDNMEDSNF